MGVFAPHIIDLTVGGPPPGQRSTEGDPENQRHFIKKRLADMRLIESDPRNMTCVLLGLFDPLDGFLSGTYLWDPLMAEDDNKETQIRPNDFGTRSRSGMWFKFN